jgi:outer membrane immunogenic protein
MSRWVSAFVLGAVAVSCGAPALAQGGDRWVGPYLGVNAGYGVANLDGGLVIFQPNSSIPYATGPLNYGVDAEGGFAGIQIGINGPSGPFFSGIEFDFQAADISATSTTNFVFPPTGIFDFNYRATASIDWFTTLRARLGVATADTLLYVTGGLAVGRVSYDATYTIVEAPGTGGFANFSRDATQVGYVLGAGIEHALGRNWSLKVEYQYLNLGDGDTQSELHFANGNPSNEKVTTAYDVDLHTVRMGINYRFK